MIGRRTRALGLALAAVVVLAGVVQVTPSTTLAAWNDAQYVHTPLAALDCAAPAGRFDTRASGRVLSGTLTGASLDGVAALDGVRATKTASGVVVAPAPPASTDLGAGAHAGGVSVSALGTAYASLGSVITVPLGAQVGALRSFARVSDTGVSTGASGLVTDAGAIGTVQPPANGAPPEVAQLNLGAIVQSTLGETLATRVSGLTDARLRIGDVASRSSLDSCASFWGADVYAGLVREYYVAALGADLTLPAVGTLTGATSSALTGVESRVEALKADPTLNQTVRAGVLATVQNLLGALSLGSVTVTDLDVTPDFSAANALLDDRISDANGIATIDLAAGTVSVDIAKLAGSVYGTTGVNGLPPNSRILIDGPLLTALQQALTSALTTWATQVSGAVSAALSAIKVSAGVDVSVSAAGLPVATIRLRVTDAALSALVAGNVVATSNVVLLGAACNPLLPLSTPCVLNGLVNGLVAPLQSSIGGILGGALTTALTGGGGGGLASVIGAEIQALTSPLVAAAASATQGLFGPSGLLALGVNAQNAPAPASGATGAEPATWNIPAPASARETRRYDVAAVRIVGLGALSGGIALDAARASAGANAVR